LLELALILANIATALTLYPVLKRRFPVLGLGFVTARLMESAFIAFGIVAIMALNTLRLHGGGADEGSMMVTGQALVALHNWTFNMGPGIVVGVGNGLILGYMMWKTRLVPRFLSILGL
jgi:mannose/fructose/N-acetylgalactosamine-specific phosphotransferase system component IIC